MRAPIYQPTLIGLLFFITTVVFLPQQSHAQKVPANPTKKEIKATNKQQKKARKHQQAAAKALNKQLKYRQDSLKKVVKQQLNAYKARANPTAKQLDSVKNVLNNPQATAKKELAKTALYKDIEEDLAPQLEIYNEHKDKLELLNADSTTIANEAKTIAIEELNKTQAVKDIKEDITPYINSPYLKDIKLEDLDSMSVEDLQELRKQAFKNVEEHYVKKMLERQEFIQLKEQQAEFDALKGLPAAYRKQYEAYKNGETIKNEALTKAVKEAQKMLAKHAPALNSAQADLAKLKKKYSSVPNSDDLSTASKRNSLKGKPLKSRLVLGGNFQVVTTNPVTIDISPVLGYRFNKDFYLAVGATYRARFSSADSTFIKTRYGQDELTYGYRTFANYRFWKAFYVHVEYEKMSKEFEVTGTDRFVRKWKPGALAGIGSEYTIKGTLKGNVSLLYNFLFDDNERVYQSPWVFRFGMGLALE